MRRVTPLAAAVILGLASLASTGVVTAVHAADLPVSAFYGTFSGGGVAENEDSLYFAVTARDFDVIIKPSPNGFVVTWTSVIRKGGTPDKPKVRRKSTTRRFVATARPGIWRGENSGDPLTGGEMSWARIEGQSLIIYQMVLDDQGAYQLQRYARKLTSVGMELTFTRLKDGERVRVVKGRGVKTGR
jgi:hypothetical protein